MATKQPSTLVEALNAFQQKHHAAGLDGSNPFYKSKYTTLAQALLAVQPATEFGLCHSQLNDEIATLEWQWFQREISDKDYVVAFDDIQKRIRLLEG